MTHAAASRAAGFTRFTTESLPETRRISQWERHNARALVGLTAQTDPGADFRATELTLALPRLQLAHVTGSAHRVARRPVHIAKTPARGAVAYFALRGTGQFLHPEGCETVAPGQGIIVDADQPFERGFAQGLAELAVKVPRVALTRAVGSPNLPRPITFEFAGTSNPAAAALARLLGAAIAGRSADWEFLEEQILGRFTDLLVGGSARDPLGVAEQFIRTHYRRPELSAAGIAAAAGISERQLSRLFSLAGRTVPQSILAARLKEAHRLLGSAAAVHLSIADIAVRCGFSSHAQFSRSYRAGFGVPPLRHRRELLA